MQDLTFSDGFSHTGKTFDIVIRSVYTSDLRSLILTKVGRLHEPLMDQNASNRGMPMSEGFPNLSSDVNDHVLILPTHANMAFDEGPESGCGGMLSILFGDLPNFVTTVTKNLTILL